MATSEMLNVRQVAQRLGVHENTVRNWVAKGILRAVRLPGSGYRRFAASDIERMAAEMHAAMAPAEISDAPERLGVGRVHHGDDLD